MLLRHQGAAVAVLAFVVPWNARPLPWNVSGAHRRPFLGVMATEPPAELYDALGTDEIGSLEPHVSFGGNLDLSLLGAGATLFLPVNLPLAHRAATSRLHRCIGRTCGPRARCSARS